MKKATVVNEYELCDGVTPEMFIAEGFRNHNGFVSTKVNLYNRYVVLYLYIENGEIIPKVTCNNGEWYGPFYNPEMRHDNDVYEEVISNYHKYMDKLVKKKLIKKKEELTLSTCNEMEQIKIKYHDPEIEKLTYIDGKSDWIDLRAAEDVKMKKGEFRLISLGVSMQLPEFYEAHIVPRSSTFKNFGVIQTNHQAVIDNSFNSSDDVWKYPVYAMRDTEIHKNDRICQFRIMKNQPKIVFEEVDYLEGETRGGFGSTGKN